MGMYEAYGHCRDYSQFMRRVVALQEGTMPLEVADNDVFGILGYDGGWTDRYHTMPQRDASSKSHRPDLYRMFVAWSAVAPPAPGVDINAPGPGPEAMRLEVCPELVLHELAFHQKVLEQLADKVHHMERTWGSTYLNGVDKYKHMFLRVDTKMPPIPDKVPTAPPRVVGQKSVPLSSDMPSVPGPLPEGLRKGVYEAYDQATYARLMRGTVALQEGTMSFEEVDADVFSILGFEGESHRPDLYQMFVEWSTAEPSVVKKERTGDPFKFGAIGFPTAPPMNFGAGGNTSVGVDVPGPFAGFGKASSGSGHLDSLETARLVADIRILDALLSTCLHGFRRSGVSETMKKTLRTQGDGRNDNLSLEALRQQWQKELLNRVSIDMDMPNSK
jgi:hypothetical protein